jgi:hypothetical protein
MTATNNSSFKYYHNNSIQSLFTYVVTQQPKGQLQNKHEQRLNQTHTHEQRQTKAAWTITTLNKNAVSSIMPAIMRRENNVYTYIHTAYN